MINLGLIVTCIFSVRILEHLLSTIRAVKIGDLKNELIETASKVICLYILQRETNSTPQLRNYSLNFHITVQLFKH